MKHSARHWPEAFLADGVLRFLGKFAPETASAMGGWIGRTFGPLTKAHRVAERNMTRALPGIDSAATLESMWDNFGRTMAEYSAAQKVLNGKWRAYVKAEGFEQLNAQAASGKPAILFSAHLGNWEIIPLLTAELSKPVCVVYRPPNNPHVANLIARVRGFYAGALAPKGAEGAREVIDQLNTGGQVWLVVDQKMNTGLEIPLFGRGAMTGKAIATLAMKYDCPVYPVNCQRLGGFRFHVKVEEPWRFEQTGDREADTRNALIRINSRIEEWVRAQPGQWLWMHKRWPD